jgi:hypothetical protein
MKFRHYLIGIVVAVTMVGCTSKDTIPPIPPKSKVAVEGQIRTYAEMEDKLNSIRNPIGGEKIGKQKRGMSSEVDTLLRDTRRYKGTISRFEKAQLLALKKVKRHRKRKQKFKKVIKKDTIEKVNEYENQLKYY